MSAYAADFRMGKRRLAGSRCSMWKGTAFAPPPAGRAEAQRRCNRLARCPGTPRRAWLRPALVRPEADVVEESQREPLFEVVDSEQEVETVESSGLLDAPPEALQARGGVKVVPGAEALNGSHALHGVSERGSRKLAALISDEIFGMAEGPSRSAEQADDVLRGRPGSEGLKGEGRAGESVVGGGPVQIRPQELLDVADVHHPDVVDEASDDGSGGLTGRAQRRHRKKLLFPVAPNGPGETLQPARARIRAMRSRPPRPRRVMVWMVERTTSAARRMGGVGFTLRPDAMLARVSGRLPAGWCWGIRGRRGLPPARSRRGGSSSPGCGSVGQG